MYKQPSFTWREGGHQRFYPRKSDNWWQPLCLAWWWCCCLVLLIINIRKLGDPFFPNKSTYMHDFHTNSPKIWPLLSHQGDHAVAAAHSLRCVWLCATSWTVALQAPVSMGFLGKNTGVSCHALLQRSFPTQGSNWSLLHCRQILYPWVTGKPTREQCATFYPQPLMSLPSWAHFQYRQRAAAGKRKMSQTSFRNPTLRAAQGMSRFHCSLLAKTPLLPSVYSFPSEKIIIFEIMWSHILQSTDT